MWEPRAKAKFPNHELFKNVGLPRPAAARVAPKAQSPNHHVFKNVGLPRPASSSPWLRPLAAQVSPKFPSRLLVKNVGVSNPFGILWHSAQRRGASDSQPSALQLDLL